MSRTVPPSLKLFTVFLRMRALKFYNRMSASLDKSKNSRFQPNYAWVIFFGAILLMSAFFFHREHMTSLRLAEAPNLAIARYWSAISLASICLTLGTSDFKKTEWDLEWLICLPVSKAKLMTMRIFERSVSNPFYFFAFLPPPILLLLFSGHSIFMSGLVGILLAFPLLILSSAIQTLIDTGARVHLKPARIKNLQALTNVLGAVIFYAAALPLVTHPAAFVGFFPIAFLVNVLSNPSIAPFRLAAYLLSCLLLTALASLALVRLLRRGVVSGSGQSQGSRNVTTQDYRPSPSFFSPLTLRELKMLGRDHQYLAQTVLAPIILLGMQIYVIYQSKGEVFREPRAGAALALGLGAYSMMSSGYLSLLSEGQALWILFTLPHSVGSLLLKRARLWISFVCIYEFAFFIYCAKLAHYQWSAHLILPFVLVFALVPLMMIIAVSLGVLGFEGVSQTNSKRMKPGSTYIYLFCLMASVACVYTGELETSFTLLTLIACAAAAFWQKALARIPFLFDPSHSLDRGLDLGDLLFGVLAYYFVFQLVILVEFNQNMLATHGLYWLAQIIALPLTVIGLLLRSKNRVPIRLKWRPVRNESGLLVAAIAALALTTYFYPKPFTPLSTGTVWVVSLPVIALCFEVLFRQLLFNQLRLQFNFTCAVLLSSFLFAIVCPPVFIPLYFLLGVLSAYLFERTRSLLPSVILHLSLLLFFIFL